MTMAFDADELIRTINAQHKENIDLVKAESEKTKAQFGGLEARLKEIEQAADRRPGGDGPRSGWVGAEVAQAEEYSRFVQNMGMTGKVRINVQNALTTDAGSAGGLIAPHRETDVLMLPKTRPFIRDLLPTTRTSSDLIQYPRQSGFTNAAAPVSEGALKPESNISFTLEETPVRTIAHWVPASKQVMSDATQLGAMVDGELRYGLALAEEEQIVFGDGTGEELFGIVPQAQDYTPTFSITDRQRYDDLLEGIAQAQAARYPATGICVNDIDWLEMMATKDGEGRYIGAGPFGASMNLAWQVRVVPTPVIPAGSFLVGAFSLGAKLYDRWDTTVQLSDSHADFFIRNMVAILAEERVALAVGRPEAFVYGEYSATTG